MFWNSLLPRFLSSEEPNTYMRYTPTLEIADEVESSQSKPKNRDMIYYYNSVSYANQTTDMHNVIHCGIFDEWIWLMQSEKYVQLPKIQNFFHTTHTYSERLNAREWDRKKCLIVMGFTVLSSKSFSYLWCNKKKNMMEDGKKIKGILIHSTNSVKLTQSSDFQCLFSIVDKCKCEWTEWNRWNQGKRRKRTSTSIEWNRNNFRFLFLFFVFYNTLSMLTVHRTPMQCISSQCITSLVLSVGNASVSFFLSLFLFFSSLFCMDSSL